MHSSLHLTAILLPLYPTIKPLPSFSFEGCRKYLPTVTSPFCGALANLDRPELSHGNFDELATVSQLSFRMMVMSFNYAGKASDSRCFVPVSQSGTEEGA